MDRCKSRTPCPNSRILGKPTRGNDQDAPPRHFSFPKPGEGKSCSPQMLLRQRIATLFGIEWPNQKAHACALERRKLGRPADRRACACQPACLRVSGTTAGRACLVFGLFCLFMPFSGALAPSKTSWQRRACPLWHACRRFAIPVLRSTLRSPTSTPLRVQPLI